MKLEHPQLPYLTTKDVANRYRVAESTVRYWSRVGTLRGIKAGRRTLFPRAEIERFERDRFAAAGLDEDA